MQNINEKIKKLISVILTVMKITQLAKAYLQKKAMFGNSDRLKQMLHQTQLIKQKLLMKRRIHKHRKRYAFLCIERK